MVAKVETISFSGICVEPVFVESELLPGLPAINIVGLPDKAVAESQIRIRSCFHSMGLSIPPKRIAINLAPADRQKEGSFYDLPIAISLLVTLGIIDPLQVESYIALGELSLDGSITKVAGVLPAAIYANQHHKGIICPYHNKNEARWAGDMPILAPKNLLQLINHFKGTQVLSQPSFYENTQDETPCSIDLSDVKGQNTAKRALEIAASGAHNLLMIGPPGSGKSMLAKRMPTIMPPLSPKESLETTMIYSISGMLDKKGLVSRRPFRDPHHSASLAAIVGGGRKTKPGEISLAHNGILFLDELPEFSRFVVESLRQPMESGEITVARADNHITYPASFQLIAAMNPCRCGYFGNPQKQCVRAPQCALDYQMKISGPIIDRFDMVVYTNNVRLKDLGSTEESSKVVRQRVSEARSAQLERGMLNAQAKHIDVSSELTNFLNEAGEKLGISARRYMRVLRVARTIADLAGRTHIEKKDILESLSYRFYACA